jgi:hypothetical protein
MWTHIRLIVIAYQNSVSTAIVNKFELGNEAFLQPPSSSAFQLCIISPESNYRE